ncbi:Hypothetical_protein [Hexamita inflata]|uniref:Hypothetical_protein n=1 Tax=Hexamita inflata TaxID=28002 RepID=A0AA86NAK9_9EUKA|nr:Hypothetical protein HINF_LOCUS3523 [Hexamita inflata]
MLIYIICSVSLLNHQQVLQNKIRNVTPTNICTSQLLRNQLINFCIKEHYLQAKNHTGIISHSTVGALHHSIYTEITNNVQLNLTYFLTKLPSFALFGLTFSIQITNSNISVKLRQQVFHGALICLICNTNASASDFTFVASGYNISSFILSSNQILNINQSLLQSRLQGITVGGLLVISNQLLLSLNSCNISGYQLNKIISGSVIAYIQNTITMQITDVNICSNIDKFYQGESLIQISGFFVELCDICRLAFYTYGLCADSLELSEFVNNSLVCLSPFQFDGQQCTCINGLVINGSNCVDILNSVNILIIAQQDYIIEVENLISRTEAVENETSNLYISQEVTLSQVQNLKDLNNVIQNYVDANFSFLEQQIGIMYNNLDTIILQNSTILHLSIFSNFSTLNSSIMAQIIQLDSLNQSIISLNEVIISQDSVNSQLIDDASSLNSSIAVTNQIINQQEDAISTLRFQVACLNIGLFFDNLCTYNYSVSLDETQVCAQFVFVQIFDFTQITNQVSSSNFSSGFVFSSSTIIKNAFINVSDGVYSIAQPLFQSQNAFNSIKIQIGTQFVDGGSLLTTSSSITMYQMNVVSKFGSQITVNSQENARVLQSNLCLY